MPAVPFIELLVLLIVALGVAIAARYVRVPYTIGLVVVGLAIGLLPGHPHIQITPDLVMLAFLPVLLFADAWTYPVQELRKSWLPIALLATVGVLISIFICWVVLVHFAHLPTQTALLFGAIVSATDPVAVVAIFRSLNTDEHLQAIVEGESLFNDATAVIAFKVTLLISVATTHISFATPAIDFVELVAGGALVGLLAGLLGLGVLRLTDDYFTEVLGTLIVAYGSYFVAEAVHVSGLIAVIVAGMLLSRVGARLGRLSTTRESVNQLWEFFAFLANSMLFLLVGLAIDRVELRSALVFALWGIVAITVARIIAVYGLSALSSAFGRRIPGSWQHVLILGGLRGALPLALVLSLPTSIGQRTLLIAMVFSVVLFTMLAQGLVIAPVVARLRLSSPTSPSPRA